MMKSGSIAEDDLENDSRSFRGLETRCSKKAAKKRGRVRSKALSTVLEEQMQQEVESIKDPERIATLLRCCTKGSKEQASKMGLSDAREAAYLHGRVFEEELHDEEEPQAFFFSRTACPVP